jgi:UDP-3-O-[3-hydroxymyristoyl] glucosamine N-acyltransferase
MEFSAAQIAELLGGKVEGNPETKVYNLSKIEEGTEGTLSFLANPKYTPHIYNTNASIIVVNNSFIAEKKLKSSCTLIRVEDAYGSFAKLLGLYEQIKGEKKGIEQPSYIHPTSALGQNCYVGAFAYVGENVKIGNNVKIYPQVYIGDNTIVGDNCILFSGVKIYKDCVIGNNCTLHASTVIGSDGFGFAPNSENNYAKVPQIGNVVIEDHVEIGSNSSVDRATLGSTIIRKGVKIDNLVQIAHNVEIGENTVIAGQTGIAGSTKIGKNCMIGAQVGINGHIKIADGVKIAGQAGVASAIEKEGEIVQGSPAFTIGDYKRSYVLFRSLPKINEKLRDLEKKINNGTN